MKKLDTDLMHPNSEIHEVKFNNSMAIMYYISIFRNKERLEEIFIYTHMYIFCKKKKLKVSLIRSKVFTKIVQQNVEIMYMNVGDGFLLSRGNNE